MRALTFSSELNPAQQEAVAHGEGPLLVIAGAGTGKTRTITFRAVSLVQRGISPQSILLLTFTRRAATEMLRRAALLLDERCEKILGGTFHHFALTQLRRFARELHLPPHFVILDRSDAEELVNMLRHELGVDKAARRFPKQRTILECFSKTVNRCAPLEETLERFYPQFAHFAKELTWLYRRYQAYKGEHAFFDYDDLLLYFNHIVKERPGIAEQVSRTFQYLLVDEYQDTNRLQAEILRNLCVTHQNIMVVGDDAQGIYSFRGANPRNIFDFPKIFPGTRIVRLEQNYRSTQPILNLANAVMQEATEKMEKKLFNPEKPTGRSPQLVATDDERAQSEFVTRSLLSLREEGIPLSEMAVLFRSSYQSFDLEIECNKCGIPYQKFGGLKFVETAHIKDVLCHLRLLLNPRDALSLHRVLLLCEGVGPAFVKEAVEHIRRGGAFQDLREPRRARESLQQLKSCFAQLSPELSPADAIQLIFPYYRGIAMAKYDDYPKRLRDIEHLVVLAENYSRLSDFLADLALNPPEASQVGVERGAREEEQLTLSTIHSAKGLEWRVVFVIWALEGKFPSSYAQDDVEELEEERRLMYVAITRAKDLLTICYPTSVYDRATGRWLTLPSRFLEGKEACLEQNFAAPQLPRVL